MADLKKYYVVQFCEQSPGVLLEPVCVPHSWIRDKLENLIVVSYPKEDPELTKNRIVNGDTFSKDWALFIATVIHETDEYIKGRRWMLQNKQSLIENTSNNDKKSNKNKTIKSKALPSSTSIHENKTKRLSQNSEDLFEKIESITKSFEIFKNELNRSVLELFQTIQKDLQAFELKITELKDMSALASDKKAQTQTKKTIGNQNSDSDIGHKNDKHEHPNDTLWTLRIQKVSEGVVEVIPNSRVYINEKQFKQFKKKAKSCTILARSLMNEIFTPKALTVCSIFEKNSILNQSYPVLEKNAMDVLRTFVKDYGKVKEWTDNHCVLKSLRSKLRYQKNKKYIISNT